MATKKAADVVKVDRLKKGDRVKVLSGDWGAGNLGTVASVDGDRVSVKMDADTLDDTKEFSTVSVVKV